MEVSGTMIRQSVSLLRGSGEASPFSDNSRVRARQRAAVAVRPWSDEGHRLYYASPPICGGVRDAKRKEEKKRAALVTELSRNLAALHSTGFEMGGGEGIACDVRENMIREAAELLLAQLNQQKAIEKEAKRRKKEALKAAKMRSCATMSSSSSSSESSDSDCDEVMLMKKKQWTGKNLQVEVKPNILDNPDQSPERNEADSTPEIEANERAEPNDTKLKLESELSSRNCMKSDSIVAVAKAQDKIEVCIGGKCKKSGAIDLLQELEKKVGVQGAVVGCKCMGKCKEGPNVRIVNLCGLQEDEMGQISKNPLCIGVGLEDISAIVATFFAEKSGDMSFFLGA